MNERVIKQRIADVLEKDMTAITQLEPTPGGLTNTSYFATINGERYVVRVPGVGSEELVNRREEMDNLEYGVEIGINPPHIYCDPETGFKITHKIPGAQPLTREYNKESETLKKVLNVFKYLHDQDKPMKNDFKLFELIAHYEDLVKDVNPLALEQLADIRADVMALKETFEDLNINYTPAHIDPVIENIIFGGDNNVFLIDWEYSGMFDPLWDLGTLIISLGLDYDEAMFFLLYYFERQPSEDELQRILMHIIFHDYLWTLWALFKESQGEDVGPGARVRPKRARQNIKSYKKNLVTPYVDQAVNTTY